jgi:hypothetical protein
MKTAARMLARAWSQDSRRWTWATTSVLAGTLALLVGASGLIDGTAQRTLDKVADFYTGDLRITPSRQGALPADWFKAGETGTEAAAALRKAGVVVAERVETQYVLSRRGFADAYLNEQGGVPVGVPGTDGDPRKLVTAGALVGIREEDAGRARIQDHIVAGRLPRAQPGFVEILMSEDRARRFLTPEESRVPGSLLDVVGAFTFDVTSVQLDPHASDRVVLRRDARVVGLFSTGVDMLDSWTLVAPAAEARQLMGLGRDSQAANVLVVQSNAEAAKSVAARSRWATQDVDGFAHAFVGQLIAVLQAVAWLVAGLLFILPAALIGHGLARQLASQQRELAVATAIGVPMRTLADALALQVLRMTAWAVAIAAVASLLLWVALRFLAPLVPAPLPLGFAVGGRTLFVAAAVTVTAVTVGLWVGIRGRSRLPLASTLRAA